MKSSESYNDYMTDIQKMTGPVLTVSEVANAFDEIVGNEKYSLVALYLYHN